MRLRPRFSTATAVLLFYPWTSLGQVDYAQYVNPFIGGLGPFDGLACEFGTTASATYPGYNS